MEDVNDTQKTGTETAGVLPAIVLDGLTDKQGAFVVNYLTGTRDLAEAATLAGYVDGVAAARRLMDLPKVRAAMHTTTANKLTAYGDEAIEVLRLLMYSKDEKIALGAAKSISDKAGHSAVSHSSITGKTNGEPDTAEDIRAMLQEIQRFNQATTINGTAVTVEQGKP